MVLGTPCEPRAEPGGHGPGDVPSCPRCVPSARHKFHHCLVLLTHLHTGCLQVSQSPWGGDPPPVSLTASSIPGQSQGSANALGHRGPSSQGRRRGPREAGPGTGTRAPPSWAPWWRTAQPAGAQRQRQMLGGSWTERFLHPAHPLPQPDLQRGGACTLSSLLSASGLTRPAAAPGSPVCRTRPGDNSGTQLREDSGAGGVVTGGA